MIDRIDQFGALANDNQKSEKVQKKNRLKNVDKKATATSKTASGKENGAPPVAKVEISQAAKEQLLLRAEAERYLKQIEQHESLDPDKVQELKQKVSDNFYLKEKVIDKIVDKLLNLPGFSDKHE